jgi:acyl-CoA hydrolase
MTDEKSPRESETQLADLILPQNANMYGTVFGGKVLEMVDKAAAVCAMRHAGHPCVTVAMDRVEFLVPIKIGHLLVIEAKVHFAGKTSIEVGVEVYAEDISAGERRHTNSCTVTMVAMDREGNKKPVPQVKPETPQEKQAYDAAVKRRKDRQG